MTAAGLRAAIEALPRPPLLVLGASEDQLPIYREAARRGIPTIGVDCWRGRPAEPLADVYLQVSTRDTAAIAAAVGPARLAGVVSGASDACLLSWAELCERYDTPYRFPRRAALASLDKAAFHEVARSVGLPAYGYVESADLGAVLETAGALRFPVVAKPTDGSGSKGVTLVLDPTDLPAAVAYARAHSLEGGVLVEEYVAGRNVTVDVFVRDGAPHFVATTEKRLAPGPHFLADKYTCPTPLEPAAEAALVSATARLCAAMDVRDGPVNVDFVLAPDGTAYALEANPRLAGNGYPRLLRAAYGVDTAAALVSLALGEPFDLRPTTNAHTVLDLIASPLGVPAELAEVWGLAETRAQPGVVDVEVFTQPGALVQPFTQAGHKLGYLVVAGRSDAEAEAALERARRTLRLTVVPQAEVPARPAPEIPLAAAARSSPSRGSSDVSA
jgi:biotin carboxylase